MARPRLIRKLPIRLHMPPRTVRLRLTALYSSLFFGSGVVLLAITYFLVEHALPEVVRPGSRPNTHLIRTQVPPHSPLAIVVEAHSADLHQLLVGSSIALVIMTAASVALGWFLAGRVLRPLRTITTTAREISEDNLHRRLGLGGPRDELKDLGDTIDGLLMRLETAFDAQRAFVANASHELRTPVTVGRAMLQVALADPALTLESLRSACAEALDAGRQQEQLIEALLILARSQRGLDSRQPIDLGVIATETAHAHASASAALGVQLEVSAHPAPMSGDAQLIERLVSNLVENALRYNAPGGRVQVLVEAKTDRARLQVTNTGPHVPAGEIARILQPFQRITRDRVGGGALDGVGLGLSIVHAIAKAHGADLSFSPRDGGGLNIEVSFHASASHSFVAGEPTATRSLTARGIEEEEGLAMTRGPSA